MRSDVGRRDDSRGHFSGYARFSVCSLAPTGPTWREWHGKRRHAMLASVARARPNVTPDGVVLPTPLAARVMLYALGSLFLVAGSLVAVMAPARDQVSVILKLVLTGLLCALGLFLSALPRLVRLRVLVTEDRIELRRGPRGRLKSSIVRAPNVAVGLRPINQGVDVVISAGQSVGEVSWGPVTATEGAEHLLMVGGLLRDHGIKVDQLQTATSPVSPALEASIRKRTRHEAGGVELRLPHSYLGYAMLGTAAVCAPMFVILFWTVGFDPELLLPVGLLAIVLSYVPPRPTLRVTAESIQHRVKRSAPWASIARAPSVSVGWAWEEASRRTRAAFVYIKSRDGELSWGRCSVGDARRFVRTAATFLRTQGIEVELRDPAVEAALARTPGLDPETAD